MLETKETLCEKYILFGSQAEKEENDSVLHFGSLQQQFFFF